MNVKQFTSWAADNRGIPAKLARAVIEQIGGWEEFSGHAQDITNHGAGGGFSGFIYYTDTIPFTRRNRAEILGMCESMRDDLGEPDTLAAFIASFNCLDMKPAEVEAVLMDTGAIERDDERGGDAVQVYNALAWYALEETARAYVDALAEGEQCTPAN